MTSKELRQKYLDFFKSKEHAVIPSASLIPENDPTALFTSAGMHPLVPYLLGEKHPEGKRLVNIQKCIRTNDIDEVGDATHHTFFEMMGNWSLGDYFKKQAIEWSWEFLTSTQWLGLDKNLIAASVFEGDEDAPFDQEAFDAWKKVGVSEARIAKLPKEQNWWGPAGKTGPCGPDAEMFYWVGDPKKAPDSFNDDNDLWVEIWNDVFMEYNKKEDGSYEKLSQQNVDTGMGLERTLAVINGLDDNYKTELFTPIIKKIEELSGQKYGQTAKITRVMRIITDHLRAAVFVIGDDKGVTPSNTDQGYIVRRLIRRAIRYGRQLEIKDAWTSKVARVVIDIYKEVYLELDRNTNFILDQLNEEEAKFNQTLEKGLRQFNKLKGKVTGHDAFNLYQTYGFPIEMVKELAKEQGVEVDQKEFESELKKHQELSKTASQGKFKSGLADNSEATTKLHTTAHLLLAALRKVLGDYVIQKGSNITPERLRLDFSHSEKLTDEQKQEVERLVNEAIKKDLVIDCEEVPLEEAKKRGAMGIFESKYGEKVKVYTVCDQDDNFSCEICAGPHVEKTGQLGHFKIIKEQSSSAGVRRIKAVLE
ncbi:MAG: alanine--tRNA ligase [Parcubacteria group bacterium]|jgi:alanyl-tRNA synthetase|nr:alanine--tRNA ligase [Parcubacteria group bacterium]